ncbi:MAG: glycogen/starch/alpha-glucan phosphorylase [Nitrospirota bacterium]
MEKRKKIAPQSSGKKSETVRTALNVKAIRQSMIDNLYFHLAKVPNNATRNDWYISLAYTVRDRMIQQWTSTLQNFTDDITVVAYLSSEFLTGPQLGNHLVNLGIRDAVSQAVKGLGLDLDDLIEQEAEPGLGSSGLGRLAACYLDSLATSGIPAIGYGIRYEFGPFAQDIRDGWQTESTDKWLHYGNPWQIPRPEITYSVNLGGRTESYYDEQDCFRVRWIPNFSIKGTAYDTPVSGYKAAPVNLLRLWKAEAAESFDLETFNTGDYFGALNEKIATESISKILYPDDEPYAGKQLRLAQDYFFVSCALKDMIRLHLLRWKNISSFSNSFSVHLNDTHPAIAVVELMRLLVDEHLVNWDKAWYITQNTFSYSNHTMLPEALQKWALPLFGGILPRHLEIIYEINRRFLDEIWLQYPSQDDKVNRLSVVDESDQRYVRMAQLACLGSHAVSAVSENHSDQLRKTVFPDLYELYPERFHKITNGVSPRRWMVLSNPKLADLLSDTIGDKWITQFEDITQLESFADDPEFMKKWQKVKRTNKQNLAGIISKRTGISVDPDSLFDIQLKRIHEYNRPHLNVLHIITLYNRIRKNPQADIMPRTFIFGGKTSPGYFIAKLIIKLINAVAETVNSDPDVSGRLKVVFFPDFNVKNGQKIYPAADLSEQITIAGKEATGTGNMKFSMNGALTIGTSGGTNTEILEDVGADNFFLFGLTADEICRLKSEGYNPTGHYEGNQELKDAIHLISSGFFSKKDANLFKPLVDSLLCRDEHMVFADYQSYIECQGRVGAMFRDREQWTKRSILTVARMGNFSSDRSIREYNETIWHASPLKTDRESA